MNNNKNTLYYLFARLWKHLAKRRRHQFLLLLLLMLCGVFAEMATLGAVLPFLGVLTNPDVIFEKYSIVKSFGQLFGVTTGAQMVLPLTLLFIGIVLISSGIRFVLLWASSRLSHVVGVDLGFKVYLATLYQPYQVTMAQAPMY